MTPELADALVRWTARGAAFGYLIRVWIDLYCDPASSNHSQKTARTIWTIGCVLFLTHIWSAFAYVHQFSHAHAYAHTAERTAEVVGIPWGGGIYVNHAFLLFWVFDVIRWWVKGPSSAYRSNAYFWTVHSIFAFMFLNATVVFGPSHWIWVAVTTAIFFAVTTFTIRQFKSSTTESMHENC